MDHFDLRPAPQLLCDAKKRLWDLRSLRVGPSQAMQVQAEEKLEEEGRLLTCPATPECRWCPRSSHPAASGHGLRGDAASNHERRLRPGGCRPVCPAEREIWRLPEGIDGIKIQEKDLIAYSPAKEGATTPPTVVGERQDSSTTPKAEVHLSSGSR